MRSAPPRALQILLASVTAMVMAVLPTLPAGAGGARLSDPPATTGGGQPRVKLVSQSAWVNPQDLFQLSLRVENAPAGTSVAFTAFDRIDEGFPRQRLADTIQGKSLVQPLESYRFRTDQLPVKDGSILAAFQIRNAERRGLAGWYMPHSGVFPLLISLLDAGGHELDRFVTYVIRLPAQADPADRAEPVAVAAIVPLQAPVALHTDRSVALPQPIRQQLSSTLDVLVRDRGVPLAIAPTPETIAALRTIDPSGSGDEQHLVAATEARQILGGPYVRVDSAAWIAAGMDTELGIQRQAGSDALTAALGAAPDHRTWIVDDDTTPEALTRLHELGVDQLVVPERLLDITEPRKDDTLAQPFDVRAGNGDVRLPAIATEDLLASHLTDTDMPVLNANHTLADMAMIAFTKPAARRGVALTMPPGDVDPDYLHTIVSAIGQPVPPPTGDNAGGPTAVGRPLVVATTLDGLFGWAAPARTPPTRQNPDGTPVTRGLRVKPVAPLGNYPSQLSNARSSLGAYRSLVAGDPRAATTVLEQMILVSGARDLDTKERQDYLDAAVSSIDATAEAITLPQQASVTLTAEEAQIPIAIDNANNEPIRVRLLFSSDKLDFPSGTSMDATLQPGTNRLSVNVRARASGAFPVNVKVSSPDNSLALTDTKFTVRSTAVSGIGLAISIAAGLFLLLWWGRHFRSVRRQSRLVSRPVRQPA